MNNCIWFYGVVQIIPLHNQRMVKTKEIRYLRGKTHCFFSLLLQRNQVQRGSVLKKSLPTHGRWACHLEWGCQGSGLGTPSLSGSRWPCSCKWQLRSLSTVQVRAYHGGHIHGKEALYVDSFLEWDSNQGGLKEREVVAWGCLFVLIIGS